MCSNRCRTTSMNMWICGFCTGDGVAARRVRGGRRGWWDAFGVGAVVSAVVEWDSGRRGWVRDGRCGGDDTPEQFVFL